MRRAIEVIHSIVYYSCIISVAILFLMMLLTVGDVIGRSIFNSPISGTYEISKFLLVAIVLLSIAHVEQSDQNARVDFLMNRMSPKTHLVTDIVFTIITTGFFVLIIWQGVDEGFISFRVGTTSDIWKIPAYPFRFLIPFGCLLLVIELLLRIVKTISDFKEKHNNEEVVN